MPLSGAVSNSLWSAWLAATPGLDGSGLSAVTDFSYRLNRHLDEIPDVHLLTESEARDVAFDLLIYCDELQARVDVRIDLGLGSFGAAALSALGMAFIPGAQIPLAFGLVGFAGLGCARKYDGYRGQKLIEKLKTRVRQLIQRLHS